MHVTLGVLASNSPKHLPSVRHVEHSRPVRRILNLLSVPYSILLKSCFLSPGIPFRTSRSRTRKSSCSCLTRRAHSYTRPFRISTKESQPEEDPSVSARLQRLQNNYEDYGMRRTVEGVLVVHDHGHPHILMLQIANAFFKL